MSDQMRELRVDRYGSLAVLKDQRFDYVFDTCAYAPDSVQSLLQSLKPAIQRYVFVSSASVYGDFSKPRIAETTPVPTAAEADFEVARNIPVNDRASAFAYGASYGPLKRACELVAQQHLGDKALVLRSGLLVGEGDYTDRLTWWVRRIDEGGKVPAPNPQERAVQMIDVRDAAAFAVHAAADAKLSGIYNLTGEPFSLATLLQTLIDLSASGAELVWVDEQKFEQAGIEPWSELPLIVPAGEQFRCFLQIDTARARRDGLACRPIAETVGQILGWDRANRSRPLKCGISREKERAVIG